MWLLFSLFFAFLLARTSSIRDIHQGVDQSEDPPLRIPLFHVGELSHKLQTSSETPLSFSEALSLDDARVKFLNSRLTKKSSNSTKPGRLFDEKSVNVPLNPGEPLGIGNYYTRIGLGNPTTYYLVVVDTGSSFSWIQCEPCRIYCHTQVGSPFNPSASNTYQKLSCDTTQCSSLTKATKNSPACTDSNVCVYIASYGDKSYSLGYLSKDSLSLGAESLPDFVFGCGQDNEGLFGKSAGLVGLARNELSMLSQLSVKYGKVFSYCLPTATPLGKIGSGGFLSIGTNTNSAYKFTPMLSNSKEPSLYFLKLSTILVSNKPIGVGSTAYSVPTIIDSGTVISRLGVSVYAALRQELVKIISSNYKMAEAYSILDACFVGSSDEISTVVPSVQFVFEGEAELNLAPHNVIIEVEKGTTCLAFAGSTNDNVAIIGNQQQQAFDIVYDLESSRIGFAAGGCH